MQLLRSPVNHAGITQPYKGSRHYGIDLGWFAGDPQPIPIYAAADGTVIRCGTDPADGAIFAVVRHTKIYPDKDVITRYWHLSELAVEEGQAVTMGDRLGYMGNTGTSNGMHLHFETWVLPKDQGYNSLSRSSYAVNPLEQIYVYADQIPYPGDGFRVTDKTLQDGIEDGKVIDPPNPPQPAETITAGMKLQLHGAPLYASSTTEKKAGTVSGDFWTWDDEIIAGRIRITNSASRVGQAGQVTGWIDREYVIGTNSEELIAGRKLQLARVPLFASSTTSTIAGYVTGDYYLWDAEVISGRIRITNTPERVGVAGQVTGWINASEV